MMRGKDVFLRLMRFVKPYRPQLLGALLCAMVFTAISLLCPVLIGRAVDAIVRPGQVDFSVVLHYAVLLAVCIAAGALFQWLMSVCTHVLSYRTSRDLRTAVFHRLVQLPLRYVDRTPHGELINRVVSDVDAVSDGLLQGFTQLFSGVLTIVGTLGFMLSIQPMIALVVVALTPLSMVIAGLIARGTHSTFLRQSEVQASLARM